MGDFLVRAADAFGLEHPHIVGPDVGTAASLFAGRRPLRVGGCRWRICRTRDWLVGQRIRANRGRFKHNRGGFL